MGADNGSFWERAVGRTPTLSIAVGGKEVEALLDTGSQVTTISEKMFRESQLSMEPQLNGWFKLTAANGIGIPMLGYLITSVQVEDETVDDVVVIILAEQPGVKQADCLLGMNVIERLKSPPVQFSTPRREPQIHKVRLVKSTAVVPAQSVLHVEATAGDSSFNMDVLIEPTSQPPIPGLIVLPTFATVRKGRVRLPILNMTDESLTMLPHTILGSASPASDSTVSISIVNAETGDQDQADVTGQGGSASPLSRSMSAPVHKTSGVRPACSTPEPNMELLTQDTWSPSEKAQIEALIRKNLDVFAWTDAQLGFTDKIQHTIEVTNCTPIRQPYRRIPPSVHHEVRAHIEDLLSRGIIRPSTSPYASPIVVVRKKNGELRLCVDYRKLNDVTRKDSFPLPRIDECLDALGGATIFSSLDLASGYYQISMAEDDKAKTAFISPFGLFEFNRLPFGLSNAPATCQRLMQSALHEHIFRLMLVYLDDILVYSDTFDKHLENLQIVFNRLREMGVRLNPNKCKIARPEVQFLGHRISAEGIATDPEKRRAVNDFPTPTTLKEVRSFVGLASYYRRFVKGFSQIAKPLHNLTTNVHKEYPKDPGKGEKKSLGKLWTPECEKAFLDLKIALTTAPVLGYADYTRDFIVETDACATGLGAVLSQKQDDGPPRVIAYASRTVRPSESSANYSSMKLELLALKWAICEKFRSYLLGHRFVAFTDNNPLAHWKTAKVGAVEQRWLAEMAAFDFEVKYKPGRNNQNADALSRNPVGPPFHDPDPITAVTQITAETVTVSDLPIKPTPIPPELRQITVNHIETVPPSPQPDVMDPTKMAQLQQEDPDIKQILPYVTSKKFPTKDERKVMSAGAKSLLRQLSQLHITDDGVLKRKMTDPTLGDVVCVVIPVSQRRHVIMLAHDRNGHQGAERTLQILRSRCYWPLMASDVTDACHTCERCLIAKKPAVPVSKPHGHLIATDPLELVAMDFTKLDVAADGMEDVLVITDVFTKWTVAVPTPDQTAESVVRALMNHWIMLFGVPLRIHSDRGKCFDAHVVRLLAEHYGIKQSKTTAYHPEGNGQCERFNRTMFALLSSLPPMRSPSGQNI